MNRLASILPMLFLVATMFGQEQIIINNQYEDGLVVDGYKKGIWNYFDKTGEMVLQVNYDNAKILFVKPTNEKFYIRKNNEWDFKKVDKQAIFLGSPAEMDNLLNENIRFPKEALKSFSSGKTVVSFVVNKHGEAGEFEVVKDFGFEAGNEVIRVLDVLPNLWLPSEIDGDLVDTKFYIAVVFEGNEALKDDHYISSDPEIPFGQPQLNVAPSVAYFKTYTIRSGNGMVPKSKKM